MSKQDKSLRRERRRADSARRQATRCRVLRSDFRAGAVALAAAGALAAGTQAYGAVVRFDNPPGPGHFEWNAAPSHDVLNVLSDAASQPGILAAAGTFQRVDEYYGPEVVSGGGGSVERVLGTFAFLLDGLGTGDVIPGATPNFGQAAYAFNTYANLNETDLPEGVTQYLGVRFNPGDGTLYGWIGVVRTGLELDAFAWGYETEPGVPIAAGAPEPASLALLALGAGIAIRRRRG